MNISQQIINGLVMGHGYALVAIGWTVLLGVARLVNFGHGNMYMVGAFATWFAISKLNLPYFAAIPITVLFGTLVGAVLARILRTLTLEQNLVNMMIVTLGFGLFIEGAAGSLFGGTPQSINSPLARFNIYWENLWLTGQDVTVIGATIVSFIILKFVFTKTVVGAYVRMVAEDPHLTQLGGIDIRKVYLGIFAFEGAAVGFAAALIAPTTPILTSMGFEELILTFVVVVIGGIGSITGSYFAGLALGLFSALFGALVSPAYTLAAAFCVLIPILVFRPGGFGGSSASVK